MEFRLLGGLSIRADGRLLPLGARKQRTLTALLLARANAVVPLQQITEELWGESPPRSAAANLRTYAARLRAALPPGERNRLVVRPLGYQLRVGQGELDLEAFERRADAGRAALERADFPQALHELELALALCRGRLAEDVQLGPSLAARATAVEAKSSSAREDLAEVLLRLDRPRVAADLLHALVVQEPLRERAWELLMRARYAVGDVGGAMDAYTRACAALVEALGVEPGDELRQVHQAVLRRDLAPLRAAGEPAPKPHGLPPAPAVVGRAAELRCATEHAGIAGSVVAVHGPAGSGTSAVALRAAHAVADRYPDGQLYVDLRGRRGPGAALAGVLSGLGEKVTDHESAVVHLRSLLAGRRMLLVLDNATDVAQIRPCIPSASQCTVLVSSCPMPAMLDNAHHVRLGVFGEADALALLAQHVNPARLEADPASVRELIVHCGHLPLALRIAAARLAAHPEWSVRELAERLRDDTCRLDELEAGDLSVRASLRVPYDLLVSGSRPSDWFAARVFAHLGSWPAAEVRPADLVAGLRTPVGGVGRALDRLVEVELVRATGYRRYRLTELSRLLAREIAQARPASAIRRSA